MEDTLSIHSSIPAHPIVISTSPTKQVLRIEADGNIVWTLFDEEIVIDDKRLLAIAFLDTIVKISGMEYDYSVIDPELWKDYQLFLGVKQ